MNTHNKVRIAVVGLGFGAEFVPIYLDHPDVESVAICDLDEKRLKDTGERFGIRKRFRDAAEVIRSDEFDAVHLVSGIPEHAWQACAALDAGKHCACTVPMATDLADIHKIVAAQKRSGKNYMMMETAVYTRPFLYAQELKQQGAFGRVQFLRGAHYQDMEGWPAYWAGLPPMWYATHAVSPLLAIAGTRAVKVHCFGSGVMRADLHRQYQNPFPVETALFQLEAPPPYAPAGARSSTPAGARSSGDVDTSPGCWCQGAPNLAAEVTRSLFHCARPYMESFTIYGENACYEWQMEDENPLLFRMSPVEADHLRSLEIERPLPLDRTDLLPPAIARYTRRFVYSPPGHPEDAPSGRPEDSPPGHPEDAPSGRPGDGSERRHLSFEQGGGHHGSHPHLVHEFVRSIVEGRAPRIDAATAANWTAAGICAHQSALQGGVEVEIPDFRA